MIERFSTMSEEEIQNEKQRITAQEKWNKIEKAAVSTAEKYRKQVDTM